MEKEEINTWKLSWWRKRIREEAFDVETICFLVYKRQKRDTCMSSCVQSEEEGSEVGEVLVARSRPEASRELILSSSMCNEFIL